MALVISFDNAKTEVVGNNPDGTLSAKQLNRIVGGYFELVACDPRVTGGYDHYYCNEEGKMMNLPVNHTACEMSTMTAEDDVIVGNVVFCKFFKDRNGEMGSK